MKVFLFVCFAVIANIASGQAHYDLYNKGNVQAQYQNYEEAIRLLTRAVAIKPDFGSAFSLRADCHYRIKAYDKAVADYIQADKYKKNSNAYNLACTYALLGKKDEAFQALEANLSSEYKLNMSHILQDSDLEILRSDPRWQPLTKKKWYSDFDLALEEASAKLQAEDVNGALQAQTRAIKADPTQAKAYNGRALIYMRTGDLQKCLEDLNAAIKAEPDASVYYGNRAYTHNKLGNKEAALSDYEKAIQLDPTNLVYYDYALLQFISGQKEPARETIGKHMEYHTNDEMGFYLGGVIASQSDHVEESLEYFDRAIELNKTIPEFFMKRADAKFVLKRYEDAVADYSTVIELNPSHAEAHYIRGNAKASLLDRDGACADWKKASSLGFSDPNNYIRDLCK